MSGQASSSSPSPAVQGNPLLARWYPLIPHPVQEALVKDNVRFKVVPAGRRSGKTERAKRYVVQQALAVPNPYFVAAPTRDQAKRIYWHDLKQLCAPFIFDSRQIKNSELQITFPNLSSISLIGLDQPQRMEGVFWGGGIIDEIADIKPNAWAENISPALDTFNPTNPKYKAWCWLIGVPDGLNHYYDMAQYAARGGDPDWKLYTWKSSEILPPELVEAARKRMSPKQFRQEYEASFETASGKVYEDYSRENETTETIQPHEQLLWHHDFNYSPMSSGIAVRRGEDLFILDEIVLSSAVSRQSAQEFVDKFKDHGNKNVVVYGDPAGRAGEKHGQASNYTEMERVLKDHGWAVEFRVKAKAPAIRDRQNAVRAKICNAAGGRSLFVNPSKAPYAHRGLATTQIKVGSTFLEEDSDYQHITTAIGYLVDYEWPIKREFTLGNANPQPFVHHFN